MSQVKEGDNISLHYTGTLDDGTVFDSSEGRDPLSFTVGSGEVIQGFDDGVRGMEVGETRDLSIPPDQAYGEYYGFLGGFTYSSFVDVKNWPDTLDYEGTNAVEWTRRALLHYRFALNDHWGATFGMEKPDIIRRSRAAGCQFYVRKPYDPNALLILIRQALAEAA